MISNCTPNPLREEIAKQIDDYLARGGEIEEVPAGVGKSVDLAEQRIADTQRRLEKLREKKGA